jgi:endogenous inhibitor of DNA gyrase (YacG/DUF329 family)
VKINDILENGPILLKTIQDVEDVISLTEDGGTYLRCYTDESNEFYEVPAIIWVDNGMLLHQQNKNGEWSNSIDQLMNATKWSIVRKQYIRKVKCAYCGSDFKETNYSAIHSPGTFCSKRCADKADLIILLYEIREEKNIEEKQ